MDTKKIIEQLMSYIKEDAEGFIIEKEGVDNMFEFYMDDNYDNDSYTKGMIAGMFIALEHVDKEAEKDFMQGLIDIKL